MKEKNREKQPLNEESLDEISGGGTDSLTYNIENKGNGNIIGSNASYEQMLGAIDKLNSSGKLNYLKNK